MSIEEIKSARLAAVVCIGLGFAVLILLALSWYNMSVIVQQQELIRQMRTNPACMNEPPPLNPGRADF